MKRRTSSFQQFDLKLQKRNRSQKKKVFLISLLVIGFEVGYMLGGQIYTVQASGSMISPLVEDTQEIRVEQKMVQTDDSNVHEGIASYYSRKGCVGCSKNMHMANGQPLDDSKQTVAFNRAKIGSKVKVTNKKNGQSTKATVTDRGGFEAKKFNKNGKQRIIDLTIATRDAIQCSHLCEVKVEVL